MISFSMNDFAIIVLLLAVALVTSLIVLAELYDFFDRMLRDNKVKDVKK